MSYTLPFGYYAAQSPPHVPGAPMPLESFTQSIVNGFQHEQPDYWLNFGNPWEIERLIVQYPIKFYGHVSVGGCCLTRARGRSAG